MFRLSNGLKEQFEMINKELVQSVKMQTHMTTDTIYGYPIYFIMFIFDIPHNSTKLPKQHNRYDPPQKKNAAMQRMIE